MTTMESPRNGVNDTPTNGSKEGEIDREKVCPLLLRVFCANSRHNNLTDYNRGKISLIFIPKIILNYFYLSWFLKHYSFRITGKFLPYI